MTAPRDGRVVAVVVTFNRLPLLQRLVARLAPVIMEVLADAEARPLSEIGSASPVLDVAAALHETAEARLFLI